MVPPSARPQDPGGCKCMCTTNAHVPYAPARRHQSRHRAASPAPTTARSPGRRRRTASPRHGDRQTGEDSRDLRAADKRTPRCADVGFVRCPSGGKDHHAPHVSVRAVSSRFAGSRVRLPFHFRSWRRVKSRSGSCSHTGPQARLTLHKANVTRTEKISRITSFSDAFTRMTSTKAVTLSSGSLRVVQGRHVQ